MVTGYGSYMLFLTFLTYRLPWHLVENIGSCATGTTHYHVPQNGHFSLNIYNVGSLAVLFSNMTLFSMENPF